MQAKTVDRMERRATALRQAIRDTLASGSRPAADRARLLGIADALDRVLLALGDTPESVSADQALDAASGELRVAIARALGLLGDDIASSLKGLNASIDALVAKLSASAARSGSVRRSTVRGEAPAAEGAVPIAESIEPMRFGASAPQEAKRGESFVARFVAYAPVDSAVAATALRRTGASAQAVDIGQAEVQRGAHMRVTLSADGLRIEDGTSASQEFVWRGACVTLQFGVEVPKRARAKSTLLKFDVSIDGLLVARVRLEFTVGASAAQAPMRHSMDGAPVHSAFASYSSLDRERVLDRVAAIRIAVGTRVFLDCHDLRPGERWEEALAHEIEACEIFMLFWSGTAAASRWVTWEWQCALAKKGLDGMQIHPLENAIPVPRELESVHVGDPYMDVRAATLARRASSAIH